MALTQLRTLPPFPQLIGVHYLSSTLEKTRLTSHINFLENCAKRQIVPQGFKLKFYPPANNPRLWSSTRRLLHFTSKQLMSQTLQSYTRRTSHVTYEIKRFRNQLISLCDRDTSHFVISTVREANKHLYETMSDTKRKKMNSLLDTKGTNSRNSTSSFNRQQVVTIPSDLHLSEDQRQVMSRGLKFVPLKPTANQTTTDFQCQRFFRRLRLAAHFANNDPAPEPGDDSDIAALFPRPPSSWTPKSGTFPALDFYIQTCTNEISQLKSKPLRHSNMTVREEAALQELQERTDIVIKPADKGGAVVVWQKDLYIQEANSQLTDANFYNPIPKKTTKSDNALIRKTVKTAIEQGHLPPEALNAVVKEPRESLFYLLPKIHKANNPGRPIVSACACPTALISAFLDAVFQPLVAALPTYVKDTNHALNLLNDFSFPDDCTEKLLFTMDIVSLYTNIPHQEGLLAIKHFLQKSSRKLHIPTILRLTELVLTLNSFSFNGDHFQQCSGVAMGTKMGPSFACLFVGYVEEQAFSQYKGDTPALFRRYIDDVLGVATCSRDTLQTFINFLSSFHPALKFTHSISDTSLSFLDISITIQSDSDHPKLTTSIFYKETDSHSYLLYTSSHPKPCRDSIPHAQFQRLRRICSEDQDFEDQAEKMVDFFHARQYPEDLIHKGLESARAIPRSQTLIPQTRSKQNERPVAVLTFHPHNLPVKNILIRNFHILQSDPKLREVFPRPPLIAYKRDANLRDCLVRAAVPKDRPSLPPGTSPCGIKKCKTCQHIDPSRTIVGPKGSFSVKAAYNCQTENLVYVLSCTLCKKLYTGETYRRLDDRFSEHLRSMRLGYSDPVGAHFNSPQHSFQHARIAVVWQNHGSGPYRLYMESKVIARLGTRVPDGLNTKE